MKADQKNTFYKLHGTGNDFIIIYENGRALAQLQELAKSLCHRNYGIGANGLLAIKKNQGNLNFQMIVINQNGSYAQMCGNGLRCFSALLHHLGMVADFHTIKTGAGQKQSKIVKSMKNEFLVQIAMGNHESIKQQNIVELINQKFQGVQQGVYFVQSGNPHLVVYVKDLNSIDINQIGSKIQSKINANINFCQILNENQVKLTTYERGCGVTLACGTGACATAISCHKYKNCNKVIKVKNKGGDLQICCLDEKNLKMCGPAVLIASGQYYDMH